MTGLEMGGRALGGIQVVFIHWKLLRSCDVGRKELSSARVMQNT